MQFLKKKIFILLAIAFFVLIPFVSFAQVTGEAPCVTSGKICNPIGQNTIMEFIKTLLEGVLKLGMPVIALALIYSGFLFVSAQGNPEALSKAKDSFMYTLIGAAVLLGSWGIAQLIASTVQSL